MPYGIVEGRAPGNPADTRLFHVRRRFRYLARNEILKSGPGLVEPAKVRVLSFSGEAPGGACRAHAPGAASWVITQNFFR